MFVVLAKFGEILARVFTSIEIEATHDSIAYHASARPGELRFSRSPSLRRHY
jgi:hypothetical protein